MFPLIMTNNSMTNHCSPHCLVIGGILCVYEVLHVQLYGACTWIAHEKIMCSQWTTLFFSTLIPPTLGDFTLLVSNPSGGTAIGTPSEGLPRCFPRAELKCSLINLSTLCRCWFSQGLLCTKPYFFIWSHPWGGFMLIMQSKKANTELLLPYLMGIQTRFMPNSSVPYTIKGRHIKRRSRFFVLFLLVARFTMYMLLIMIFLFFIIKTNF
jgi:hypothetical protein